MIMNAVSYKYFGFFSIAWSTLQSMKSLKAQRNIHKLYALYLAVHAYAVNTIFSPFLQGSMGKQLTCKWDCYESQVPLTLTHPASAQSFMKRRCCFKRPTIKWKTQNLNEKVTGYQPLTKHNLILFQKNKPTAIVRDELITFKAVLKSGSHQVQSRRQWRHLMLWMCI